MITSILFTSCAVWAAVSDECARALDLAGSAKGRDRLAAELEATAAPVEWVSPAWADLPRGGAAGDHRPSHLTRVVRDHLAERGFRVSLHLTLGARPSADDPTFGFASGRWSKLPPPHLAVTHVPYLRVTRE